MERKTSLPNAAPNAERNSLRAYMIANNIKLKPGTVGVYPPIAKFQATIAQPQAATEALTNTNADTEPPLTPIDAQTIPAPHVPEHQDSGIL